MESCATHPEVTAVEHCEICGRPLCGLCLWYSEDGRRLCEDHASEIKETGAEVLPPETYSEAFGGSLVLAGNTDLNGVDDIPYKGNSTDLSAFIAFMIGLVTLFSCMGGAYCLPIAAALLGLVAFSEASKAVDPRRTKIMAGLGISVGALMFICILLYIGFFVFIILFGIFSSSVTP